MKKCSLLIGCLLVSAVVNAQSTFAPFYDTVNNRNQLAFSANVDLTGTSLRKEISNSLLFGGEISVEMKNRSMKSHKGINREGVYVNSELSYVAGKSQLGSSTKYTWMIKAGYHIAGNLNYSSDAYRMMFYGNQHLENDTAKLSGIKLRGTQFQKLGFGVVHKKSGSSLTLNLVNVQNHFSGFVRDGVWSQNSDVDQIDLRLRGNAAISNGKQFSKGLGFAFDFESNFKVPWGKDSAIIQLGIHNLGAAYLFVPQDEYQVDTTYHYNGFTINQIKNSSALFGGDFSLLDTLSIRKSERKGWMMLPAHIQVMKLVNLSSAKNLQSFFGIRFYPTLGVVPTGYAGIFYRFIPKMSASANIAYGGSSIFRAGLALAFHTDYVSVQLGSDDLYGLFSKKGFGQSVILRLSWKF